jgi:hypothetical protein
MRLHDALLIRFPVEGHVTDPQRNFEQRHRFPRI